MYIGRKKMAEARQEGISYEEVIRITIPAIMLCLKQANIRSIKMFLNAT